MPRAQGQQAGGLPALKSAGSQALAQLGDEEPASAAAALDACLAVCARHARDAPPEQAHASYFVVLQQLVQVRDPGRLRVHTQVPSQSTPGPPSRVRRELGAAAGKGFWKTARAHPSALSEPTRTLQGAM